MTTVSEALRIAVGLHQGNRLAEAADIYRKIIQAAPEVADAWHLLGVLHHQSGQSAEAVRLIGEAIRRDPLCAAYRDNLGSALRAAKQTGPAVGQHRAAMALDPAWVKPFGNLAGALTDLGDGGGAAEALRRALRLAPDNDGYLMRLGDCLYAQDRMAEAEEQYRRLDALHPGRPDCLYRLGLCRLAASRLMAAGLANAGRLVDRVALGEALAAFGRAAEGGHGDAGKNLYGTAIVAVQTGVMDDGTLERVAAAGRRRLMAEPRDSVALSVVCYALYRRRRLDLARRYFRKYARHWTAQDIAADFEMLLWSMVRSEPAFFDRLSAAPPGCFARAVRHMPVAPKTDDRPILLVGCDGEYWRRFGAGFLETRSRTAASCAPHVHVVNPPDDVAAELMRLAGDGELPLSVSFETVDLSALSEPVRLTYFASARFAVTQQLLRQGAGPVIQVDVDALLLADPGLAMAEWRDWDVAVMQDRRSRGPTRDFLAGFLAFNRTPAARRYLDLVVAYIGRHFDEGRAFWGLDQAAPYCTYDHLVRSGGAPALIRFDFEAFPFLHFLEK
ncbi:tetratricopeptide (TPR) repeat protein [Azospirillum lipoferum]|uniref:Tetratricopeptide repeat protein n=1 Tax=Azospirillum lipoferum TaxID=193 RepID=A0A5A9GHV5_AZOLI|nr:MULTISPECIES: tetratricopeptide repeat protein [Azospirillum]KAA0594068.1 tetratricopeptide repeat protein [Azospirillum lipoferum]MCP1612558.1 tetratricopeptide (TPR) repeat protein [Azospirillum lipoferum]MDW5531659.1 tetratricopeptide repeat protein [Azospirillum sp. NL1]